MRFASKLDRLLAERGLSQRKLAEILGLKQPTVSKLTKGTQRPYLDQALQIARYLDVPLEYLADDEQDGPAPKAKSDRESAIHEILSVLGPERAWRRLVESGEEGVMGEIYVVKRPDGLWFAKTAGGDDDTATYPTAADALGAFVRDRPDEFQLFALSPSVDDKTLGKLFYEKVVRKGLAKVTVIRMQGMNVSIKSAGLSPDEPPLAEFGA